MNSSSALAGAPMISGIATSAAASLVLPRATRSEMVSDPLAEAETITLRRVGAATARGARATSLPADAATEADVAAERGAASIARADRVPRGGFRGSKGEYFSRLRVCTNGDESRKAGSAFERVCRYGSRVRRWLIPSITTIVEAIHIAFAFSSFSLAFPACSRVTIRPIRRELVVC